MITVFKPNSHTDAQAVVTGNFQQEVYFFFIVPYLGKESWCQIPISKSGMIKPADFLCNVLKLLNVNLGTYLGCALSIL
jgi:hypothetical protein